MKKLLLAALVLGVSTTMFGAVSCIPINNISNETNPCLAGNLLFSNFSETHLQGVNSFGPTAVQAITFPISGNVVFSTNPNQGNANEIQEDALTFVVTGIDGGVLIFGASSSNGGNSNTDVHQVVCAGTVNVTTGVCTGGAGATLLDFHTAGGIQTPTQFFAPQSTVTVWRDSLTPAGSAMTGGSFDLQSSPEPIAMLLAGSGLALVGLLRRRRRV
jgi:hypothetical protein